MALTVLAHRLSRIINLRQKRRVNSPMNKYVCEESREELRGQTRRKLNAKSRPNEGPEIKITQETQQERSLRQKMRDPSRNQRRSA